MDPRSTSESPEELQSLRARLYDAEQKLRALESGGEDAESERLTGAGAQSRAPDSQQEEFLVMLAHEFRNPLAPIRTAVEIIQMIGQKDAALDKALDVIARQVDHLSRLVDNLLDISRITQQKARFTKQRIDVNALLSGALETALPLIDERRHRLIVAPTGEPASIEGDLTRLVQVIANLLDNAARYTEPGGEIRVSASTQDGLVVISVADNGAGISAELLPRIFDMFMQAERGLERSHGGLGIGLSVVRTIVLMHGGTVEARSDGPGSGSEIIVRLPLVQTAGLAELVSNHHGGRDMPRRIVVIDDNQDAADSIAMLLRLKGHEVHVAYDGLKGMSVALETHPDCVLVDIGLPGIDGYEVAKRLRLHRREDNLLLVALTGYGQSEDKIRSEEAGFDHHLVKPVSHELLEDILRV